MFQRKQRRLTPRSVNMIQPRVEWHLRDARHPKSNTYVHTFLGVGTSKHLDSVVVGNHKELRGVIRIPQWYWFMRIIYEKVYICRHKILSRIARILLGPEPNPWRVLLHLYWFKWKEAIKEDWHSLIKREVFTIVKPAPHKYLPEGREVNFCLETKINEVVRKRGL